MDKPKQTYEWNPAEGADSLDGEVKFIIGGRFTRPIHMASQADCDYVSELLALAYQDGYTMGKDRIRNQLVQILRQKD